MAQKKSRKDNAPEIREVERLLKNYIMYTRKIERDKKKLEDIDGIQGMNYDKVMTCETYEFRSKTEDQAVKRVELQEEIQILQNTITKLNDAIGILDDIEQDVINLKYIEGYSWSGVARECLISESGCRSIKDRAVRKMASDMFCLVFANHYGFAQLKIEKKQ